MSCWGGCTGGSSGGLCGGLHGGSSTSAEARDGAASKYGSIFQFGRPLTATPHVAAQDSATADIPCNSIGVGGGCGGTPKTSPGPWAGGFVFAQDPTRHETPPRPRAGQLKQNQLPETDSAYAIQSGSIATAPAEMFEHSKFDNLKDADVDKQDEISLQDLEGTDSDEHHVADNPRSDMDDDRSDCSPECKCPVCCSSYLEWVKNGRQARRACSLCSLCT